MKRFSTHCVAPWRMIIIATAVGLVLLMAGSAAASARRTDLPSDVISTLHYLLDLTKNEAGAAFDAQRIAPFMGFLL